MTELSVWLERKTFTSFDVTQSGVDFIKVGPMAQIIEIALLKLGAQRKARTKPLKSFSKVGRRAQNGL